MSHSVVHFLGKRQLDDRMCLPLRKRLHVTSEFIKRLTLEKVLEGHTGCVNCLEWDANGRKLASASDDIRVVIWDPFTYKKLETVSTGHHGNIFSVKFMPDTNEETIVTGAGDDEVRVHNVVCKETTRVCTCHTGRVKRLAVIRDVIWSAAEDGLVRQLDLRLPHTCNRNEQTVLIDLRTYSGQIIEAKCIAVNPLKPELIAVGANDPYIRLFDRRMIRLIKGLNVNSGSIIPSEDNIPAGCVQHFVPGHIACKRRSSEMHHDYSATYVVFGPNGNELLANLGSEQIYLFDITTNMKSLLVRHTNDNKELTEPLKGYCSGFNMSTTSYLSNRHKPMLPDHINALKLDGNSLFERECYTKSIRVYNQAIGEYPDSSVFYSNRAAAYMKRDWCGDTYAALRDCITALNYDPNNVKAFFRMTRCLFDLSWYEEAKLTLNSFKELFPSHAKLVACRALERDILSKLEDPEDLSTGGNIDFPSSIHPKESEWRERAKDYMLRFYGHCNTTTDIKEANFFGSDFIVAGSDDGSIFVWDRKTTNNIRILKGDSSIVNCVQPHPTYCLLATSGIEHRVRLWSPRAQDGVEDQLEVLERDEVAETNQRRMQADPFDVVLMNMGFPRPAEEGGESLSATYGCRTS